MADIKGWRFPVEPDPATGRIRTVKNEDGVRQGVYLLLKTEKKERPMLPGFGAGLSRFLFETVDETLVHTLSNQVVETVQRWTDHVDGVSAEVTEEEGGVVVAVRYRTDFSPGPDGLETHLDLQN